MQPTQIQLVKDAYIQIIGGDHRAKNVKDVTLPVSHKTARKVFAATGNASIISLENIVQKKTQAISITKSMNKIHGCHHCYTHIYIYIYTHIYTQRYLSAITKLYEQEKVFCCSHQNV